MSKRKRISCLVLEYKYRCDEMKCTGEARSWSNKGVKWQDSSLLINSEMDIPMGYAGVADNHLAPRKDHRLFFRSPACLTCDTWYLVVNVPAVNEYLLGLLSL